MGDHQLYPLHMCFALCIREKRNSSGGNNLFRRISGVRNRGGENKKQENGNLTQKSGLE
jgi:hypothetical protein